MFHRNGSSFLEQLLVESQTFLSDVLKFPNTITLIHRKNTGFLGFGFSKTTSKITLQIIGKDRRAIFAFSSVVGFDHTSIGIKPSAKSAKLASGLDCFDGCGPA